MRLPQESNCGSLSWRFLILGLQFIGAFPYTVSELNQTPRFSIKLCLWSIYMQTSSIFTGAMMASWIVLPLLTPDVGNMAFIYSSLLMFLATTATPLVMAFSSKKLANLLSGLGAEERVKVQARKNWYCNRRTIVFNIAFLAYQCFVITFAIIFIQLGSLVEKIYTLIAGFVFFLETFLPLEISEKTFDLLSKQLTFAANLTFDIASANRENTAAIFSALHSLDCTVRKVSPKIIISVQCLERCKVGGASQSGHLLFTH